MFCHVMPCHVMLPRILLVPAPALAAAAISKTTTAYTNSIKRSSSRGTRSFLNPVPALLTLTIVLSRLPPPPPPPLPSPDAFCNVPQTLSGDDGKQARIRRPKSRQAESCTAKCVGTCIRGGAGSPGEGPLNVRRPLVVFKQGFRTRQYCLVECSDICNLIKDGDDGP